MVRMLRTNNDKRVQNYLGRLLSEDNKDVEAINQLVRKVILRLRAKSRNIVTISRDSKAIKLCDLWRFSCSIH